MVPPITEIALQVFAKPLQNPAPDSLCRKIQAHLLIGDVESAVDEAEIALKLFPGERLVYEWAIKSYAAAGKEEKMIKVWEDFNSHHKEASLEQVILEEMCWGILKKGSRSSGITSQLISLIGAALAQDMRAVPFLIAGMRHSNANIREIAVELAAFYGDHPLKEEISRLFKEEIVIDIRVKVILAIGKLRMESLLNELIACIADPATGPKEKLAAIKAIIEIREKLSDEELKKLAASPRGGLRQLACEVIAACELEDSSPLLLPLMSDPNPEVAAAAIKTWGLLKKGATEEVKKLALEALDPLVGITASWVWLIDDPVTGEQGMEKWLDHELRRVRTLAASAIATAGPYGVPLAKKRLPLTNDPYVKANLALALAGQREACELACSALEEALQNSSDKWMVTDNGIFKTLEKSQLSHKPSIPNYPEVINQTVRLELLNILAILEAPQALEAIKAFLKERKWGVTGLAAETLLGEGDESAIDLVKELLADPDPDIRLEAAIVLASWAKDYSAVPVLLEVYPKADRHLKLKILESLGRIGDKSIVPFLIDRLREPSLMMRMVAASVLIQTLNH